MQSYPLKVAGAEAANVMVQGDYFVYESATTGADTRILVKPENGGELILKPGQRFRIKNVCGSWGIRTFDGVSTIAGALVIGEGEFEDSNVTTMQALASATITNTAGNPVPVTGTVEITNDVGNPLPVSVTGTVNTAEGTVQYTNSWNDTGTAAVTAQVIVAPGTNVNGMYIDDFECIAIHANQANAQYKVFLSAKATAPANSTDGAMIFALVSKVFNTGELIVSVSEDMPKRVKIPAGVGLYLTQEMNSGGAATCIKKLLYTLL